MFPDVVQADHLRDTPVSETDRRPPVSGLPASPYLVQLQNHGAPAAAIPHDPSDIAGSSMCELAHRKQNAKTP
jgi:hypothetical protein